MRDQLVRVAGLRRQNEALGDEIRLLVRDAKAVGISMAEVARLLEMDRSTLYRVYRDAA